MITCESISKRDIRSHYDWATLFYRLLWGPHIHHGVWECDESPGHAQRKLIEHLVAAAGVRPGGQVLDVGCGMGGSAIYLARRHGCRVVGLTLSPVQRAWARTAAWLYGVGLLTEFRCQDAETVEFPPKSFDLVWSIECTEHLFDKPRFFRCLANWLLPGGRAAICAWLAAAEPHTPEAASQVYQVCEGFLCPSLGTARDYLAWMDEAGLKSCSFVDLSEKVARTWEICLERARRWRIQFLAGCAGPSMVRFVDRFETILSAYRTGALRYGCFVAAAPG
jgi:tocopherol O-methyltransferase